MIDRIVVLSCACGLLSAQTTWIVNAAGGPGVHFADLPSAVVAAAHGDTILVYTGPFAEGATGFVTNKGLTIVGVGGQVPIYTTAAAPVEINGLPAGHSFRMAGFQRVTDGELNVRVVNCSGAVHLEGLAAREPDAIFPNAAAVVIGNSASVTLRAVDTFGYPAVDVNASRVVMTSCRLGLTFLGLGGGPCLWATNATVDVVQPRFDAAWYATAIQATNTQLAIAGSASALVASASPTTVVANGGALVIDPAVPLAASAIAGTAPVTYLGRPASFPLLAALPGATWSVATTAGIGSVVFQALGEPGLLQPTPLGTLGIEPASPYAFFPAAVVSSPGIVVNAAVIPAGMPRGAVWATQAVVWNGAALELGLPVTCVVQ